MSHVAPMRLDVVEHLAERLVAAGVAVLSPDGFPARLQVLVSTGECAVVPVVVARDRVPSTELTAALVEWVAQIRPGRTCTGNRQIILRDTRIQVVIDVRSDTGIDDVVFRVEECLFRRETD